MAKTKKLPADMEIMEDLPADMEVVGLSPKKGTPSGIEMGSIPELIGEVGSALDYPTSVARSFMVGGMEGGPTKAIQAGAGQIKNLMTEFPPSQAISKAPGLEDVGKSMGFPEGIPAMAAGFAVDVGTGVGLGKAATKIPQLAPVLDPLQSAMKGLSRVSRNKAIDLGVRQLSRQRINKTMRETMDIGAAAARAVDEGISLKDPVATYEALTGKSLLTEQGQGLTRTYRTVTQEGGLIGKVAQNLKDFISDISEVAPAISKKRIGMSTVIKKAIEKTSPTTAEPLSGIDDYKKAIYDTLKIGEGYPEIKVDIPGALSKELEQAKAASEVPIISPYLKEKEALTKQIGETEKELSRYGTADMPGVITPAEKELARIISETPEIPKALREVDDKIAALKDSMDYYRETTLVGAPAKSSFKPLSDELSSLKKRLEELPAGVDISNERSAINKRIAEIESSADFYKEGASVAPGGRKASGPITKEIERLEDMRQNILNEVRKAAGLKEEKIKNLQSVVGLQTTEKKALQSKKKSLEERLAEVTQEEDKLLALQKKADLAKYEELKATAQATGTVPDLDAYNLSLSELHELRQDINKRLSSPDFYKSPDENLAKRKQILLDVLDSIDDTIGSMLSGIQLPSGSAAEIYMAQNSRLKNMYDIKKAFQDALVESQKEGGIISKISSTVIPGAIGFGAGKMLNMPYSPVIGAVAGAGYGLKEAVEAGIPGVGSDFYAKLSKISERKTMNQAIKNHLMKKATIEGLKAPRREPQSIDEVMDYKIPRNTDMILGNSRAVLKKIMASTPEFTSDFEYAMKDPEALKTILPQLVAQNPGMFEKDDWGRVDGVVPPQLRPMATEKIRKMKNMDSIQKAKMIKSMVEDGILLE